MSSFTKKLIVSLDPKDKRYWYIEEEIKYYEIISENEMMIITIPKGFRTDFASIPKSLYALPFIEDGDKFNKAAVLHDFCYCTKLFDRKKCDELFYKAMALVGIPKWKRDLFYKTVRLFGKSHFGVKKGDPNYKLCNDEKLKKEFLKIVKLSDNINRV